MLRAVYVVALETFILLRRDKIFVPGLVTALLIALFASLAANWGIEEFDKLLFDVGYFGFEVMGGLIAIFWGTKIVSDSRQEGALEVQLAAPVPRPVWLVAKFLGLAGTLVLLGVSLLVLWQAVMLANDYGVMRPPEVAAFALMVLGWLVLAAASLALGCVVRQGLALFGAVCLWVTGLASVLVAHALPEDTPEASRAAVRLIARIWDLGQFNLTDQATGLVPYVAREAAMRGAYGVLLILALLTGSCIIFQRRDVVG
jgi:ABC-type transport system involved in multi-copper enzyme maturation permease subunit